MAIIFTRSIIVFASILVSMRFMGKRQLGELELSELVVAVLLSDMAAHPLQDIGIPLLNGMIPIVTLLCCELLICAGTLKSVRFRRLMWGRPSILVENGKILQKELVKNRLSLDELTEALRKKDIQEISELRYAILETDGTLNTVQYESFRPATPSMLNLQVQERGMPLVLISDGRVISENLRKAGKDENWLSRQLKERNIVKPKDVFYMTLDEAGGIYFTAKEV